MPIDYSKRGGSSAGDAPSSASAGPVSLTKRGQAVNLSKSSSGKPYRFNLNWNPSGGQQGGGFMAKMRTAQSIDLDLGCLYELRGGKKGAVQALGNSFGSLQSAPWIQLDKDDRSGNVTEGENLFISSEHQQDIERMIVFAFIYEGVASWSQAAAVATIHQPDGPPITINLNEHADGQKMCGIALLKNVGGQMQLSREVQYCKGHRDLDAMYGWGMSWTAGRK
jgi:tellurite resistance protein TerA